MKISPANLTFHPIAVALILAAVIGNFGCGGGSGYTPPPTPPQVQTVTVTPNPAYLLRGTTQQFAATVIGTSKQGVTWSVQESAAGTIDRTGLFTASQANAGTFHVIATSTTNSTAQGVAIAIVVSSPFVAISPAEVMLPPGGTQTFAANAIGLASSSVSWKVQEAGGGQINGAGLYTAPSTAGFYHVVATSAVDATITSQSTISVTSFAVSFLPAASLHQARGFHTATLLNNGKVLVSGGANKATDTHCAGGIVSAELYDSDFDSFALTGALNSPRYAHTATLLPNGKVLVAGGFGNTADCQNTGAQAQNSAELYNPDDGLFSLTGAMSLARGGHTATLLVNNKVLIVGGGDHASGGTGSASAELYDPSTGAFTSTGSMAVARFRHTATLLDDGRVLIAGGVPSDSSVPTSMAEIYDPATGKFTAAGHMTIARDEHTATLLDDGTVLIAGGESPVAAGSGVHATSTAEIYDPATGSFTATGSMTEARDLHTATQLQSGYVLLAGGEEKSSTAELYNPTTRSFSSTGGMEFGRSGHTATPLTLGSGILSVLVVGGGSLDPIATAELYSYGSVWDY